MQDKAVRQILRVDHAGETGAIRIYAGQSVMARLLFPSCVQDLQEMQSHERTHYSVFERLLSSRKIRRCHALPLWAVGGWTLGLVSGMLGSRAIWVCTAAVESVVNQHLDDQIQYLSGTDPEAHAAVLSIKRDEESHRDAALARGGAPTGAYRALWCMIASATSFAIWLSTKL